MDMYTDDLITRDELNEIEINADKSGYGHHAGGDCGVVKQFLEYLETGVKADNISDITHSVLSHELCFLAEKSRKHNGKIINLK